MKRRTCFSKLDLLVCGAGNAFDNAGQIFSILIRYEASLVFISYPYIIFRCIWHNGTWSESVFPIRMMREEARNEKRQHEWHRSRHFKAERSILTARVPAPSGHFYLHSVCVLLTEPFTKKTLYIRVRRTVYSRPPRT